MTGSDLARALQQAADRQRATHSARFFKTAPGEYGYGDQFLGVTVPAQRQIARQFYDLELAELEKSLHSKIHEQRLTTLIILVEKFKRGDDGMRQEIYELYLRNTKWVNNWDLVDTSAEYIVGAWLSGKDRKILTKLARSDLVWERRIAIMATFAFIKAGQSAGTLKLAKLLLHDDHDLIQKAVGWMLREVGKRVDQKILEDFLMEDMRYKTMPRTMLRYAIERLPESSRKAYLAGNM